MALLNARPIIGCLLAAVLTASVRGEQPPDRAEEYRLKAAILFNLAKFVDWPENAFSDPGAPLVLCVLGSDPFGSSLDDVLRGRSIGRRTVVARRIAGLAQGCHVLFIAGSERKRVSAITERLRDASVLTVSEDDAFTSQGGMIALETEGERVRFDINGGAAERAGLKVSARLLSLASASPASRPGSANK